MEAQPENHPLRRWLSSDEFSAVKPHVECAADTDLSKLFTEDHAEIYLNTEITFASLKRDVRRSEWFPERSCIYRFQFRGVISGISIQFSARPNDPNWRTVRDTLFSCLAKQCRAIKRLSIHGYAIKSDEDCGFMGSFDAFDGPSKVFSSWADSSAVLNAFADAGYWTHSLQQLDLWNYASSISPSKIESLTSWPQNVRNLHVAHLPWETNETVNQLMQFFPTVERLLVGCSNQFGMHYPSSGFCLWRFFECLQQSNPNIRCLQVAWNAVACATAGTTEQRVNRCLSGLKSFSNLEHLTIGPNEWDGTRDMKALAHGILRLLPETSIRELRLQTIPVSKECLYEQLSREDCQLDLLDAIPYDTSQRRGIPLTELSKFTKNIHIPAQGDRTTLDFVFLLRRFRGVLSLDFNQATSLWPLLLAQVGKWKVGKGVSMPLNRRHQPTHWLTDKGIQPQKNYDKKRHDNLTSSLFYALFRERADIVCAGLQSQSKPNPKPKRAAQEPPCSGKRLKLQLVMEEETLQKTLATV